MIKRKTDTFLLFPDVTNAIWKSVENKKENKRRVRRNSRGKLREKCIE